MGKQICFYVTQSDINALVEQIGLQGGLVIDSCGKLLEKNRMRHLSDYDYCRENFGGNKFFITKPEFLICYKSQSASHSLDEIKSEAIEFSLCTPLQKKIIDTSSVDRHFTKSGILIVDDPVEYNRRMEELMKNPTYIDNPNYVDKGFEHGRFWYSSNYLNAQGEQIRKTKELDKLFYKLSQFVKDNFIQSKDKFAYIGTNAYEKYLQKEFIPCSGRTKIII